jgi:DNA-binding MarR family transcriptional regulator
MSLTDDGAEVTRHLYAVGDSLIDRLTADWSADDRRVATDLLERLARSATEFSATG